MASRGGSGEEPFLRLLASGVRCNEMGVDKRVCDGMKAQRLFLDKNAGAKTRGPPVFPGAFCSYRMPDLDEAASRTVKDSSS